MASDTELLNALFAAAAETNSGAVPWYGFLTLLGTAHRADSARLQVLADGQVTRDWPVRTDPDAPVEPGRPISDLLRMRNDRVYSQADIPGALTEPAPLRAVRVAAAVQGLAVLTLHCHARDFRASDTAQLSRLAPYLGQAVATREALQRNRDRAAQECRLTQAAGVFWLHLTPGGRVTDSSPTLRAALDDMPGLRLLPTGWLRFDDPAVALAVRRGLAQAQSGAAGAIDLGSGAELVLSPGLCADSPGLHGVLRRAPSARDLAPERIAAHFGLSHSEARLTRLICAGLSLQDAATELGWTLETTRSCSKRIFHRMGVTGQPGVLRKVWASAVWFT